MAACAHAPPPAEPIAAKKGVKLAVLPAESDAFPNIAKVATVWLASARVAGVDETALSKVSLEVVQLSIECVDASASCYQAVGRSLAADRLLFAQISGVKHKDVKITVTLFDVVASAPKTTVEKLFPTEQEATAGLAAMVAEATR